MYIFGYMLLAPIIIHEIGVIHLAVVIIHELGVILHYLFP
jgi:hypothetical protein